MSGSNVFADPPGSGTAIVQGILPNGQVKSASLSAAGDQRVAIAGPLAAFGELRIAPLSPVTQADAIYGLPNTVETFSATGGSATAAGGLFVCQTGTSLGGYGVIRSRRPVRYRPGQGAVFRFTAMFDSVNAVALSFQGAGAFNSVCGFFVGYNGTDFGVLHETGGAHETRTLTISAAATGAETVSLTLDGTLYSIPVTSGTVQHNAYEIAAWLTANQSVWEAYQNDDTVVLFKVNVGAASGSYSVSSTGTLAGSIAQDKAGQTTTKTWDTVRSGWLDPLDGTGPSGMNIDPATLKVYELDVQYLSAGAVDFKIENPDTGRFFTFYRWTFPNSRTTPTLTNPSLKPGWAASSLGSTGTNITVKGASVAGEVDGPVILSGSLKGLDNTRASVGGTLTSIFAVRVRSVFKGIAQLHEAIPELATIAPAGTKPCLVRFLLNPTFAGEPDWQYVDEPNSILEIDTAGTTFADEGSVVATLSIAGGGSGRLTGSDLTVSNEPPLAMARGDVLCIAATISGGSGSDVLASLTIRED